VLLQPLWFLVRKIILSVIILHLDFTVIWQVALMTLTVVT